MAVKILYQEQKDSCRVLYKNNLALAQFGVSFHWWKSEATSLHNHDFFEFFIITQGSATHEINGKGEELPENTLRFIRPEDMHRIKPCGAGECMHMNIPVTESRLKKICLGLGIDFESLASEIASRTVLSPQEMMFFTKRAEQISMLVQSDVKSCYVTVNELIAEALSILFKAKRRRSSEIPPWFVELTEKLHSPDYFGCNANDVYALASFSPPVTVKYFKEYTGKTVCEYLRDIKVHHARDALIHTDISILELSNILGYSSLSHFNRIFKNAVGLTPAMFRKENKFEAKGEKKNVNI